MQQLDALVGRSSRAASIIWACVTLAVAATVWLLLKDTGAIPPEFYQAEPGTIVPFAFTSVVIVWLVLGALLFALRSQTVRETRGFKLVCAAAALILYANVFREHTNYGDYGEYIQAAVNLESHAPFHGRYLYPPFFATLLSHMLPAYEGQIFYLLWTLNLLSVGLFAFLLCALLERYGFAPRAAAGCIFAFVAINVPMLRTLAYVQVNFFVVNAIFLSILWYPRHIILSALALAFAAHLKISPCMLALPFLLCRDWRWLLAFALGLGIFAAPTLLEFGPEPFLSSFKNVQDIYSANGGVFRENSVDSLFRSGMIIGLVSPKYADSLVRAGRAVLIVLGVAALWRALRWRPFAPSGEAGAVVLNAAPVLMLTMMVVSPLMWEHHPVFAALPFLVMLRRVSSPGEWVAYGFALFLIYYVPTFDFYPWSYGRLVGAVTLLVLMVKTSSAGQRGTFEVIRRAAA